MKSVSETKVGDATIAARPPAQRRWGQDELAFLPAALEIAETPPSPTGRAIGATIILLFCLALIWACFGEIDIVASATGKVIPSGRTKVIQPLEIAVVRAIHVQDGQVVKAGDPLVELDPTINAADATRLKSDLIDTQTNIARLRAALSERDTFQIPAGADILLVSTQRQFLTSQIAEHRAKIATLDRQAEQREAEAAAAAATIAKLEAVIPVIQQRFDIRKSLRDSELGSKLQYLEMLQTLVEQQRELDVQKSRLQVAQAAAQGAIEARTQVKAEYRRMLLDELSKFEQRVAGLTQDLVKAEQRTRLQLLTAPVDGTVQQLEIHTTGGVVSPAQTLLVIVPTGSHPEIEAMVSNRDIGFVQAGQVAEIKIDTFSFTKYGLIPGRVISISQDAISRQKPPDKSADKARGAEGSSSEPAGQELLYAARVSLDRTLMQVEDKLMNLSPGMAVTVEIKTGTRTVLSYLLSPLLRYRHDSLRER